MRPWRGEWPFFRQAPHKLGDCIGSIRKASVHPVARVKQDKDLSAGESFRGYIDELDRSLGPFRERYKIQFRAEFFNVFNRANFNNPSSSVNAGAFGSITSASDPRIGQLALKIVF